MRRSLIVVGLGASTLIPSAARRRKLQAPLRVQDACVTLVLGIEDHISNRDPLDCEQPPGTTSRHVQGSRDSPRPYPSKHPSGGTVPT